MGTSITETTANNSQYGPNRSASGKAEYSAPSARIANTAGHRGSVTVCPGIAGNSVLLAGIDEAMMNVARHLPMKVVVQSSSLIFTVLSILLHVPITRVKRKPGRTGEKLETSKAAGA